MKRNVTITIVLASAWITSAFYAGAFIVVALMTRVIPVDEMDRRRTEFRRRLAAGDGHRFGSPERKAATRRSLQALFGFTPFNTAVAEHLSAEIEALLRDQIRADVDLNHIPEHLQERAREAFHRIQRNGNGL